ncbi:hypothetical protein T02_291 [Trichinella nativa]|uniref:Uncharacterized protein n=1 Tax=Trichinella nativa TaxID=6335 RepID=A0A0V1LQH6_9BILA|nr:hypothetical protein T02_291 [Trichinella nativa]
MFRYIFLADFMLFIEKEIIGSTEIRTRIAGFKVPPRFELGLLDSKSRVLAVTPWNRQSHGIYYRFVNALPLIHDVVVRIRQQRFVYTLATFAPADCRHDGRKAV